MPAASPASARALAVALLVLAAALGAAPPAPAAPGPVQGLLGAGGCVSDPAAAGCAGQRGLDGASDVARSPDGRHVYVAAANADAVAVLARTPGTGALTPAGCTSETGTGGACADGRALDGATGIAVSPDGAHVYVASATSHAVATFERDAASGALTQAGCVSETGTGGACSDGRALWGASAVDVTGDGTRVVVAASTADAVTSFTRDPGTGALDAGACISESGTGGACGDGRALDGAADVVTAGHRAFVASGVSDGLAALVLDAATGAPAQPAGAEGCVTQTGAGGCARGTALDGARGVAAAGDVVHVAADVSDAVAAIRATPGQALEPTGCVSETGTGGACADGRALDGARAIALGPDGRDALVASAQSDAVAVLAREPGGALSQRPGAAGCAALRGGPCRPARGLDGARAVLADPNGRQAYAAGAASDAVTVLDAADRPACAPVRTSTNAGERVFVVLSCSDPDGDGLALVDAGASAAGGLVSGTDPVGWTAAFEPAAGFSGDARFTYRASDGLFLSDPATATVTVRARPATPSSGSGGTTRDPRPAPPAAPPAPALTASLAGPGLGVERVPVGGGTALPLRVVCLPGSGGDCAGTITAAAGRTVVGTATFAGPGVVTLRLSAAARRAVRRARSVRVVTQRSTAYSRTGGRALGALARGALAFGGGVVDLPVALPKRGRRRTGTGGPDVLSGTLGDDHLSGGASPDRLSGGAGIDRLGGGGAGDRVSGGSGIDRVDGGYGNDALHGGTGDDLLAGASGDDRVDAGTGADEGHGGTGNDRVDGGAGDDRLDGFDGDDVLLGGPGDDYVVETRFGDDDLLDGGSGDDYVDAHRGNDRAVLGGPGDDILRGGSGGDRLDGGPGNDAIDAGPGEDTQVAGGEGDDLLVGGRGPDGLVGGPGDDVLYGSTGPDRFDCGDGEDWIHVDAPSEAEEAVGCEHVVFDDPTREGALDPVRAAVNRGLLRGGASALARGSATGDIPASDRPVGTDGADELTGGPGRDLFNGNGGDDLLVGLAGDDDLDGGDGADELRGGDGRDRLFGRFGDDTLLGDAGDDELEGGRGRDTLHGGAGHDRVNGGFDPDDLFGEAGDDVLVAVGGGADTVHCGAGRDRADVDRSDTVADCEVVRRH